MSENWHHSAIHIAINDESQGSIAKNLKCGELLYYTFIIHSAGERIFEIGEHLAKLRAKWLTVSFTPFTLSSCRSRQISWITCVLRTETVINRCYVNRQINVSLLSRNINCCRPVMTYWLRNWRCQWLTDCWSCTKFCSNIFFFVTAVVYSVNNGIFIWLVRTSFC